MTTSSPDLRIDEQATQPLATEPTDAETAPTEPTQLFADEDSAQFQDRWRDVQVRFVDDPQGAVRDADALVAEVTQALTRRLSEHKSSLEAQWSSGEDVQTEGLRLALQDYREFFHRILAA